MMKEMLKSLKYKAPSKAKAKDAEESYEMAMEESAEDMYDSGEQGLAEDADMEGGDMEIEMEMPELESIDDEALLAEVKRRKLKI